MKHLALIPALLFAVSAAAQSPRDRLLVSVDWLAQHLNDPDLVLLHVGPQDGFQREHIAGAQWTHMSAVARPRVEGELTLEVPDPSALRDSLVARGVTDRSRIVVYWGDEWVTPTARVMFTLDWAGLGDRTVLLDGGIEAWKAAGRPVTTAVTSPSQGTLTIRPRSDRVVDAAFVQRLPQPRYALVDAREGQHYDGVMGPGHIPGAGSLPWSNLVDERLHLRPAAELRALFANAGVDDGDTVVVYCHIGQYATEVIFAARTLGFDVRLYDGAQQDWQQRGLPWETGGQ